MPGSGRSETVQVRADGKLLTCADRRWSCRWRSAISCSSHTEDLKRATAIIPSGYWPAAQMVGTVTLIYADRCRQRIRLTADDGKPFLLDLERPMRLADGDGLQLMGHSFIKVVAAVETVAGGAKRGTPSISRASPGYVGNRSTAAEMVDNRRLRLVDDAVLRAMPKGLGAELATVEAPFHPEGGAYAGGDAAHGHEHGPRTPYSLR